MKSRGVPERSVEPISRKRPKRDIPGPVPIPSATSTTPPGSPGHFPSTSAIESQAPETTESGEEVPDTTAHIVDEQEREVLLQSVEKASHVQCDWIVEDICIACRFQDYQRICIEALVQREISKTEIADVMAVIGVFAPSMPTERMNRVFSNRLLKMITTPTEELPGSDFDNNIITKAVQQEEAYELLYSIGKKDRKIRVMLEALMEYLPRKPNFTISESTFVVKHVAPIVQAIVDNDVIESAFPNTESTTQKRQGIKADRPDISCKAFGTEICWGEVTGPIQERSEAKNKWDTYRLVRFGKAFLDAGNHMAPLFQVVYTQASYMRLSPKVRGMFLLQEVGSFIVPSTVEMIPSLIATIPTLLAARTDIQRVADGDVNRLNRSWGYKDLENAKNLLK
ncbi:hypothetical protein BGZ79_006709 [Entomortierella chlamydospora]|nr:hypothetical protein BGZ79_006709 [Entomortierella chlamydospora]